MRKMTQPVWTTRQRFPCSRYQIGPVGAGRVMRAVPAHTMSTLRAVAEYARPYLSPQLESLVHREDHDVLSSGDPALSLLARGEEIEVLAESVPDGLNAGHPVPGGVQEHDG